MLGITFTSYKESRLYELDLTFINNNSEQEIFYQTNAIKAILELSLACFIENREK